MKKINSKGFVLTETLMVTVFIVTIFLFVYMSILPLIGRYRDMSERDKDIDIVYKLYHVRRMIEKDNNKDSLTNSVKEINCNLLANGTYCNSLMQALELNNYSIIYTPSLNSANLSSVRSKNTEIADYAETIENDGNNYLFLNDTVNHTVAHMIFEVG